MNKNAIYNFFKFTTITTVQIGSKVKETIHITNKPTKQKFATFIFFCLCYYTFLLFFHEITGVYKLIIFLALVISTLAVLIKSKLLFGLLEHKTTNINIYQRELPSNLKPAHVRMLVYDGLIDELTIASTILDLIEKGYLKLQSNYETIKSDTFFSKNTK